MKRLILWSILSILHLKLLGCPLCEKQQPRILRGITHGTGPESNWDYVIIGGAVIIVFFTLYFSVKYLIKPEENDTNHIKRLIINFN